MANRLEAENQQLRDDNELFKRTCRQDHYMQLKSYETEIENQELQKKMKSVATNFENLAESFGKMEKENKGLREKLGELDWWENEAKIWDEEEKKYMEKLAVVRDLARDICHGTCHGANSKSLYGKAAEIISKIEVGK